jgi:hypothetical protein
MLCFTRSKGFPISYFLLRPDVFFLTAFHRLLFCSVDRFLVLPSLFLQSSCFSLVFMCVLSRCGGCCHLCVSRKKRDVWLCGAVEGQDIQGPIFYFFVKPKSTYMQPSCLRLNWLGAGYSRSKNKAKKTRLNDNERIDFVTSLNWSVWILKRGMNELMNNEVKIWLMPNCNFR